MRLSLILLSLAKDILLISADDHLPHGLYAEEHLWYGTSHWGAGCEPPSCSSKRHLPDALTLNRDCLIDRNPKCTDAVYISLTYNHTKLHGAHINHETVEYPVLEFKTPLFPGGWMLAWGNLFYPLNAFATNTPKECQLYYKEGDLLKDNQPWNLMPKCFLQYTTGNKYYHVACENPRPQILTPTHDKFYIAALQHDGKNCFKPMADLKALKIPLEMEGEVQFIRGTYTHKIPAVQKDHVTYTIKWDVLPGSNHTKLPADCSNPKISWAQGAECIKNLVRYSNEYFITSIRVDISNSPGIPSDIRSNEINRHIPAMAFDFKELMFFNDADIPKLDWKDSKSGFAFNLHMNGTANLYVAHNFGLPPSSLKPVTQYNLNALGSSPIISSDSYLLRVEPEKSYERVIFVDKDAPANLKFTYDGFFELHRTNTHSVHAISQTEMRYKIRWVSGCGTVSEACHNSLHFAEAKACVDKATDGCQVKISASIEPALSLTAVETTISGKKLLVPGVFYESNKLFFDSIKLTTVELTSYSFGDDAEGDLFVNERMGGNPPQGKVSSSIIIKLSLNNGQYIYLDQPIKSSDHKFTFSGAFTAVGIKKGTHSSFF